MKHRAEKRIVMVRMYGASPSYLTKLWGISKRRQKKALSKALANAPKKYSQYYFTPTTVHSSSFTF